MIGGMSQGNDGLDLVVTYNLRERPRLLPAPREDLTWLNDDKLAREDVIVSVPPEFVPRQSRPCRSRPLDESRHAG